MTTYSDILFKEDTQSLFTLRNPQGAVAQFTTYGARWVSMWVPDRKGVLDDVVLGFDALTGYKQAGERYHGAIVGRVCGRISNGCFRLDGQAYRLAANDVYGKPHPNHLHGGLNGLHNCTWEGVYCPNAQGEEGVRFTTTLADGQEGYPGRLQVEVTYTLSHNNTLRMECRAASNKPTPVNLTNHAFFNLSGEQRPHRALAQELRIASHQIVACDDELIPTGALVCTDGTELDFSAPRTIASSLQSPLFRTKESGGFSLAFALDGVADGQSLALAAQLHDPESGRQLSIFTNQPSLQVYTAYFMDGSDVGKGGEPYGQSAGIALETQGYPDAVNHPAFPSIILIPGREYCHQTEYRFNIDTK